MKLAQYRRKFPNLDWNEITPAVEFAMEPADARPVLMEIRARQRKAEDKVCKRIARKIWSPLDLIGSNGQDCEHTVRRVLEEAGHFKKS